MTIRFLIRPAVLLALPVLFAACAHVSAPHAARHGHEHQKVALPNGVTMDMIWVPPGVFQMGQYPTEQDAYPNKETPRHTVTLTKGYWLGTCEVTKGQWRAVMGTAPWAGRNHVTEDGNTPAVCITWDDAQAFVARLSALTGKSFRLPTEAEWEYACRAGTTTRFYWGDDPAYEQINRHAWWRTNAMITDQKCARPVGLMPPNPWGFHDMSGNVSEWCQDWHGVYPPGPATDPTGLASAEHRVLRGGSWTCLGGHCRSSRRHHELPGLAMVDVGFRVAR